jgi:hypothetical protein
MLRLRGRAWISKQRDGITGTHERLREQSPLFILIEMAA